MNAGIVAAPARFCPRCENAVILSTPTVYNIYDCKTCENILFESEVDVYPGQTKGKPRKTMTDEKLYVICFRHTSGKEGRGKEEYTQAAGNEAVKNLMLETKDMEFWMEEA